MPDADELAPASRRDSLALGLTNGRSFERAQAAEVTASVVSGRLVEHLNRAGFVIMRKPVPAIGAGDKPGRRGFEG